MRGVDPAWPDTASCRDHPSLPPDSWFDTRSSVVRAQVVQVCSSCPVLAQCAEWSITTPSLSVGVFGGLTDAERRSERTRRRRQAAAQEARQQHRRELQRGYNRRSERLRRVLGLAESPEHQRQRYQRDPEPQKARSAAYYAEHKEAILKARREARRQKAPAA
jgi:hypothetical protein